MCLQEPMPKKGGPNHRRFTVTVYRLSGNYVTIPGCSTRTSVQYIIDTVTAASRHIVPSIYSEGEEYDVHLVLGDKVFFDVPPRLTLRRAHIDSESLLFAILTADDQPPPLVDTSD